MGNDQDHDWVQWSKRNLLWKCSRSRYTTIWFTALKQLNSEGSLFHLNLNLLCSYRKTLRQICILLCLTFFYFLVEHVRCWFCRWKIWFLFCKIKNLDFFYFQRQTQRLNAVKAVLSQNIASERTKKFLFCYTVHTV